MKNSVIRISAAFIVGVAICSLTGVSASAQPTSKKYSKEVEAKIKLVENNLISWVRLDSNQNWNIYDRMQTMHVNGLSIAVINNYKIEWTSSYGWADTIEKRKVTDNTLFQSASIGKSINGFAFMKLAHDKKLNLYTDINAYLKHWKFPYDTASHGKKITIADILSHTAGLSVHGFDGYKANQKIPTLLEILDGVLPSNNPPVRSEFEPGLKFQYSGGGYEITEKILEDVTQENYAHHIKQNIFKPLKMDQSTYAMNPTGELATAYRFDGQPIGNKYHLYPEKACGAGLWTSASDLARFVIEIQLSLRGDSKTILSQTETQLMLRPYITTSNAAFGFFIDKKGDDLYFQHSGLNEGFSSQYYGSMTDGNGVVVLVNSDNTSVKDEVVNSVATVYQWPKFYDFVEKKIKRLNDSVTNKYLGQYKFNSEESGPRVIKENGELYIINPDSPEKWKMYFTSTTEFFMLEARWANQQFYFDEKGRVAGFYILGNNHKEAVMRLK